MKLHIGGVLLGVGLALQQPAAAQTRQDTAPFLDKVRADVGALERKYAAGKLRGEAEIIQYVQALTFLGRYDTAFNVQNEALEAARLPRSAEHVRLAADLLLFQNKGDAAEPYLQEALSLGDTASQIQLAELYVQKSQNSDDKNCALVEAEVTKAIAAGMDAGTGGLFMGFCYFEQAQQKMQPECRTDQRASAYSTMPNSARADIRASKRHFRNVPKNSAASNSARHWLTLYRNPPVLRQYMCGEIQG